MENKSAEKYTKTWKIFWSNKVQETTCVSDKSVRLTMIFLYSTVAQMVNIKNTVVIHTV